MTSHKSKIVEANRDAALILNLAPNLQSCLVVRARCRVIILQARQFAERAGLKLNDKLTMNTMAGPKQFTVRGVMKGSGLAPAEHL